MFGREEVVINLESRIFFRTSIATAEIREHIEAVPISQKCAHIEDRLARYDDRDLAVAFNDIRDPAGVLCS